MATVDITPSFLDMRKLTPKKIAALLREHAATYPEHASRNIDRTEIVIGGLRIRCAPSSAAILAIAKKFDKAVGFAETCKNKVFSRRFSASTYSSFCESGELQNAYEYAVNWGREVFFECTHNRLLVGAKTVPGYPDFVSATFFYPGGRERNWDVYHTLSGLACSSCSTSRNKAVSIFTREFAEGADKRVAELPAESLSFLSQIREQYAKAHLKFSP